MRDTCTETGDGWLGDSPVPSYIFIRITPCMIHHIHEVSRLSLSICIHQTTVSRAVGQLLPIPSRAVGRLRRLGSREATSSLIYARTTLLIKYHITKRTSLLLYG
jgi:hypothetical protein